MTRAKGKKMDKLSKKQAKRNRQRQEEALRRALAGEPQTRPHPQ